MNVCVGTSDPICKKCKKICKDTPELTAHMVTCLKGYEVCDICGLAVTQIRKHKLRHDPINAKYECDTCGWKFFQRSELRRHEKKHQGQMEVNIDGCPVCKHCNSVFNDVAEFQEHGNTCFPKHTAKFVCDTCGQRFRRQLDLDAHEKHHDDSDSEHICRKCNMEFMDAALLRAHVKTCNYGPASGTCDICGIFCTQIRKHTLRHNPSNARYMCDTCGRKFFQRTELTRHESIHKRKVPCTACGKLVAKMYLKNHIMLCKKALASKALVRCRNCSKVFASLAAKQDHMEVCKSEKYPCEICGKVYTAAATLKNHHAQTHSVEESKFKCSTCGKCYRSQFRLSEHEQTHKPKVLCKTCGKMVYATKRHEQACQNPNLHKCEFCDCTIKGSLQHLERHIERNHGNINVGKSTKGEYHCKKCGEKYMYKGWVEAHERECQGFGLVLQSSTEPEISEQDETPTGTELYTDDKTVSEQVEVAMVLPSDLDTQSGDTMLTDLSTNTVYIVKKSSHC